MSKIKIIKEKNATLLQAKNQEGITSLLNYNENLINEISKGNWSCIGFNKSKRYFKRVNNYYLHYLVVDFYYSKEYRIEMFKKGYVIDHLDNDGTNNCIENLHFLSRHQNTKKNYDIDIKVKRINDKGVYYIHFTKDLHCKYYLTIHNKITNRFQNYIYNSWETLNEDLKVFIGLIEENKTIPFDDDFLKYRIFFEDINCLGIGKQLLTTRLFNSGLLQKEKGILI